MATSATSSVSRDPVGELRQERDRFVALAFSAADVLFELDRDCRIAFTAGAASALLGEVSEDLIGRPFRTLVAPADQGMIDGALSAAGRGTRINGLVCRLQGKLGTTPPLLLLGYQVPDLNGHYFLGARLGTQGASNGRSQAGTVDTESGLPSAGDFAALAAGRLAELDIGENASLTMLRLADLDTLRGRLDNENRRALSEAIGSTLRANAIGGDLAGELDGESYGLVHRAETDLGGLAEQIEEIARTADPEKRGIGVSRATVALDKGSGSAAETAKALSYVFARFAEGDEEDFPITRLTEGLAGMVGRAEEGMAQFRDILANGAFDIAFQPVVDLKTQRPRHFEALARFRHLGPNVSPYETITFAEQTGLIREFDIAMCARVLEWLEEAARFGYRYKMAVNVSGTSIASKVFVEELHKLLRSHRSAAEQVIFEITESSKIRDLGNVNATLQSLRRAGHLVCLDDFGAGAAAFQYLRELEVDVVKIDGAYVRGALKTVKGKAFLRAMASLCHDLGITTVAEMIEDKEAAVFLRDCGVGFGQGYLFGRPSLDIGVFEAPRRSELAPSKKPLRPGV